MDSGPFERRERALGGPKLARAVPKGGPPGPSGASAGEKAVCLVDETGEAIGVEVYVAMLGASNQAFTDAPRPSDAGGRNGRGGCGRGYADLVDD